MTWIFITGLAASACIVSIVATAVVLRQLTRKAILDRPNERSSHEHAVPRGGGIAVMAVAVAGWCLLAGWRGNSHDLYALALLAAALATVSFIDDLRGLPTLPRFITQIMAVALGSLVLPEALVFQGLLPPIADRLATGFCWLWFINLFNFMDGIDGITTVETACIGLGIGLVTLTSGIGGDLAAPAAILAGAALGFGVWNWRPAKIFMGDVGSVSLGFLLGWLLLSLAAAGHWLPALLLPLYYLTDATWTLLRRLVQGERIWQAHRSHFYQYAVRRCGDHSRVALLILACNIVLIAAAHWAGMTTDSWPAIAVGGIAVGFLLYYFATMKIRTIKVRDEAN